MPRDAEVARADDRTYDALVADLRQIIVAGRGRAAAAVTAEIVATYWQIGERVVREEQGGAARAGYGEQILRRVGRALSREFGRGFAEQSLRAMRQFYVTYPNRSAVRSELGWTHYRTLMRLPDAQRAFYERLAVSGRWSSRELDRQINSMLYARAGLSSRPAELALSLPDPRREPAPSDSDEVFRDPYVLDFLGLDGAFSEKDLEAALVANIEKFLLALGTDFCFVGRQYRISIGGDDFYVDLVFYHRGLRAPVLVDLKVGRFEPADAAQMRLYLNWFGENDKRAGENDPIGLILCGSKNEQVVRLLLANPDTSADERIRVAQYLLLDSEDALRTRLAELSAAYDEAKEAE